MTTRIRYSGALKMRITLTDGDFYCVNFPGTTFPTLDGIGLSPYASAHLSLNSSEAFDEVARVAPSFLAHELEIAKLNADSVYELTETDWDTGENLVRRSAAGPVYRQPGIAGVRGGS